MKTMKDQLVVWCKANDVPRPEKPRMKQKKKQDARKPRTLTERELADLMGMNMRTLKRGRGGAYK